MNKQSRYKMYKKRNQHLQIKQEIQQITQFSPTSHCETKNKNFLQVDLGDYRIHHVFDGFLDILLNLLAHRDYSTYLHSLRVAEISRRIGRNLFLTEDEVILLEHGGLIHDIGKISIPDDILLKPGRFSNQDRNIMNTHSVLGAQLFYGKGIDERLAEIALNHHERLDGSGYPNGLQGDHISLYARIIAVADVYEALIAKRPYKESFNRKTALDNLWRDVDDGKLEGSIVLALEKVTLYWNPLEIKGLSIPGPIFQLEDFRRSTYFREPMSPFYNYRYLFTLENNRKILFKRTSYSLLSISFLHLKILNRVKGYIETDRIINAFGERLQEHIDTICGTLSSQGGQTPLLLKKGADYVIYCPDNGKCWQQVQQAIANSIKEGKEKNQISCLLHHRNFSATVPFEDALNQLFETSEYNDQKICS